MGKSKVNNRTAQQSLWAVLSFFAVFMCGCVRQGTRIPTAVPTAYLLQPTETAGPRELIDDSPRPAVFSPVPPTGTAEPTITPSPFPATRSQTPSAAILEYYVVQDGDTLGEIALQFGVELEELARLNGIEDLDHIEPGQQLIIP